MTTRPDHRSAAQDAAAALDKVHQDLAEVVALLPHSSERERLFTIALGAFRAARFAEQPAAAVPASGRDATDSAPVLPTAHTDAKEPQQ